MSEIFDTELNRGDRPLGLAEFRDAFRSYDAVLPTVTDKLPAEAFCEAPARVKILANYGVGFSHIDTGSAKDRGIVVILDPRIKTKPYGRTFLESLPDCRITEESADPRSPPKPNESA